MCNLLPLKAIVFEAEIARDVDPEEGRLITMEMMKRAKKSSAVSYSSITRQGASTSIPILNSVYSNL